MLKVVVGASLAAFEFFLIVGGDAPVVRLCRAMALWKQKTGNEKPVRHFGGRSLFVVVSFNY
jgi:hypothetical protein